jgi:hypothetical protein
MVSLLLEERERHIMTNCTAWVGSQAGLTNDLTDLRQRVDKVCRTNERIQLTTPHGSFQNTMLLSRSLILSLLANFGSGLGLRLF